MSENPMCVFSLFELSIFPCLNKTLVNGRWRGILFHIDRKRTRREHDPLTRRQADALIACSYLWIHVAAWGRMRYIAWVLMFLCQMMTSSNGNILRVTGLLFREIRPWPVNSPHKGQWRGGLMFSSICAWISGWINNRGADDLRRHRAHMTSL